MRQKHYWPYSRCLIIKHWGVVWVLGLFFFKVTSLFSRFQAKLSSALVPRYLYIQSSISNANLLLIMNIVLCVPTCNNVEYEMNVECCPMWDPGKSDCPSLITTGGEVRYLKGHVIFLPWYHSGVFSVGYAKQQVQSHRQK